MTNELDELRILAGQVKNHFTKVRESRALDADEEAMALRATHWVDRLQGAKSIILNGKEMKVDSDLVSYEDVMVMAGENPKRIFSITWSVRRENRGGCLAPGETVRLEPNMIFNAYNTSNA